MQLLSLGPFVSNSVSSSHRAGASERVFPFEATNIGGWPEDIAHATPLGRARGMRLTSLRRPRQIGRLGAYKLGEIADIPSAVGRI